MSYCYNKIKDTIEKYPFLFKRLSKIKHLITFSTSYNIIFKIERRGFKPSKIVNKYLYNLHGIEIGASKQNSFHLKRSINVNFADDPGIWENDGFKKEIVNLVANGDDLPFKDETLDYVLSSHVFEHFFDPIKTLNEWMRVVKKGGYVIMIVPHKDRTFDKDREVTTLNELIDRSEGRLKIYDYIYIDNLEKSKEVRGKDYENKGRNNSDIFQKIHKDINIPEGYSRYKEDDHHHWSVWRTQDILDLCKYMKLNVIEYQNIDDKVGNGFTVVIRK